MHQPSLPGEGIRSAGRGPLARALAASRADTLARLADWQAAGRLDLPYRATLNPPLWEAGHVGWFQAHWTTRNAAWRDGTRADPSAPLPHADDALYDSSRVAHRTRWSLPLPAIDMLRDQLARQLDATLALLAQAGDDDASLYFFRLVLLHEDMHHEAAIYMLRSEGVAVSDTRWRPQAEAGARDEIAFGPGRVRLGHAGPGFGFDNELPPHEVEVPAFAIDRRVVTWAEYLPFVDAGHAPRPAVVGAPAEAACGMARADAAAWCAWAGRRLPTEAEWQRAAAHPAFGWGRVWEWTATPFAPFPGFEPHPYRDYSAPWFDGRPVLKGASWATQPRLVDARYRNFFDAGRTDLLAGFRSAR